MKALLVAWRELQMDEGNEKGFDGLPYGGLLELVRDLIAYTYRDFIRAALTMTHPKTNYT